jgi:protein phosphatase 1G
MGAYLSEPNLNKESIDDTDDKISFGASSMQGWRLDQEVFINF